MTINASLFLTPCLDLLNEIDAPGVYKVIYGNPVNCSYCKCNCLVDRESK